MKNKENCLAYAKPELVAEWHPTKNGNITPETVLPHSNKKVWWQCCKGHEWESVISARTTGSGCPYCANHKAWPGYNDLSTLRPDLAREWNYERNGELIPQQVTCGSSKKVWWQCPLGHQWESTVANRNLGNRCPICKNAVLRQKAAQRHLERSGSLLEANPRLAKEWHPSKNGGCTPQQLTANSPKKVWWLGECGHEWEASVVNRNRGTNCPFCCNQKVLSGFNDLSTKHPEISKEWHPLRNGPLVPSTVLATSGIVVWWRGECGHEWQQAIDKRTTRGQGCPLCGKRGQTSFPEQALFYYIKKVFSDAVNGYEEIFTNQMELDIFIPSLALGIEYDGANWHDDSSLPKERSKYEICKQQNITLVRIREDADEPKDKTSDYFIRAKRHPTPQELDQTIGRVFAFLGATCSIDSQRDSADIRNGYMNRLSTQTLSVLRPDIACEWHPTKNGGLTPDMFSVSSGTKVWWLCSCCGHEWETRIATRSQGVGCLLCGYKKRTASRIKNRLERKGSLADTNPVLAKEWHPTMNSPLTAYQVLDSSRTKVWWKCNQCKHEWSATINSRSRGNGCPSCARKKQKKSHNE